MGISAHYWIPLTKFQFQFWCLCKIVFTLGWHLDFKLFYWILPQNRYINTVKVRSCFPSFKRWTSLTDSAKLHKFPPTAENKQSDSRMFLRDKTEWLIPQSSCRFYQLALANLKREIACHSCFPFNSRVNSLSSISVILLN